ncbi:calcium-binding protein [Roseomonas harenae]|uniref:calcium-binding protein n=1 Tax=Muricoccus harenae TaxID=2692566 RepID=UPI00133115B2|nr:calcium-binding protein [Roseomonas harenae]
MSAGNDIYKFRSISEFLDVTALDGGAGLDMLRFVGADGSLETATGGAMVDADFAGITNFESMKVGNGNWDIDLGANAKNAFTGGVALVSATETTDQLWVQVRAGGPTLYAIGSAGNDRLYGGGGDDTLNGGAGNDTFTFYGNTLTSGDTVNGGSGYDVLRLLDSATLGDDAFTNVSNIEAISVGAGAYSLTFGAEAMAAFDGGNVRVHAVQSTDTEVDASALGRDGYRFAFTGGDGVDSVKLGGNIATVTGGGGADEFILTKNAFYKGVITDFQDGIDHLVIQQSDLPPTLDTPEEWDALIASITSDTADGLLLDGNALGLGGTLTLAGVTKAEFDHHDFILV